jgi:hypothetical protein
MKKTTLFIIGTGLFVAAIVTPVYAQTPATRGAVRLEANVSRLKTRADAEITRRITALNGLITKINAMVRLTAGQKTTFSNGINGQISSLNTLKIKIDADTDIATLRTDVQSIIQSYRIFALYLPQVNIMSNADRILALVDEMNAISTKLQTRIDAVKTAGKDTMSMQTLMTDRASKLTDAATQANNAIAAVVPLTPAGYPGNRTTLTSARNMLQTARQDLVAAEKDATQIRQTLRSLGITPKPTP